MCPEDLGGKQRRRGSFASTGERPTSVSGLLGRRESNSHLPGCNNTNTSNTSRLSTSARQRPGDAPMSKRQSSPGRVGGPASWPPELIEETTPGPRQSLKLLAWCPWLLLSAQALEGQDLGQYWNVQKQ